MNSLLSITCRLQGQLIDVPILAKLQHGSIRYRYTYGEQTAEVSTKGSRTERPHEGQALRNKQGYFYHARLTDFSEDANYNKEAEWQFLYVNKGPDSARQKKLYYVYGKGIGAKNKGLIEETHVKPIGQGYKWPAVFKQHGHVYYDLVFPKTDEGLDSIEDESDITEVEGKNTIRQCLTHDDRIQTVKGRLSLHLLKAVGHIHLYFGDKELESSDVVGDLNPEYKGRCDRFLIHLLPK